MVEARRQQKIAKKQQDYDELYGSGRGWKYSRAYCLDIMRRCVVQPTGLTSGWVLEVGCGEGLQTSILRELGFKAVGWDLSVEGIKHARERYPECGYIQGDATTIGLVYPERFFDLVYARNMSWFHYRLDRVNRESIDVPVEVDKLFRHVKDGGFFALQVTTDFTGRFDEETKLRFHALSEYMDLLLPYGKVVSMADWGGVTITGPEDCKGKNGLIVVVQKSK